MRYAIWYVADQTFIYLKAAWPDGTFETTTVHSEALLFDDVNHAGAVAGALGGDGVESIEDLEEFLAKPDTW